jgi:hypothetical protein
MLSNKGITHTSWFWRTQQQQEIDYIEERDGRLYAYEFKWKRDQAKFPLTFTRAYPESECAVVNSSNFDQFLM